MTAGVLRSFEPDEAIACVLVDNMSETTLRVCGSDRMTIAVWHAASPFNSRSYVMDKVGHAQSMCPSLPTW